MACSILDHFRGSYAVNVGKIDPWGTFRILCEKSVPNSGIMEEREEFLFLRAGLPIWHETLASRYNKEKHHVRVTPFGYIAVVDENGTVVEKIPSTECVAVELREVCVADNGHLFSKLGGYEQSKQYLDSIKQIAYGEKPSVLDNSMFKKVNVKYSGQELVTINHGTLNGRSIVYTKDGKHVSCKCYYPLSYDKWTPGDYLAEKKYTKVVFT